MTNTANIALIPTRTSGLYGEAGIDLAVAAVLTEDGTDTVTDWQPVSWNPAEGVEPDEDGALDWDWKAQLNDLGYRPAADQPGRFGQPDEYDIVAIEAL